ncbi:uncharacterized protein (DUF58 family) [Variovorax boronicumulans]|uniref:DUF58 domain-containing protein n=1 Tax=Variovorax paradoxus (strain EPS) TaxID=595537 RepID=E6V0E9_VARPE|nr:MULTISPECIES: DUF58 domain-containing protein [Variovorax]ADU35553.1 protein of unknown function DUF58 [Variovorax paradoxus EPS]MDP9995624.1 uncharacterized protein (DUF58 family) [Variovorax boronicumulans]MDQ0002540.1 uncharacterized protein (DUF58 family) [Variovorax boronicumulans]MDQ0041839.1 uncharacterized protein (DUF58 family) [Variovorax boronicumulans]
MKSWWRKAPAAANDDRLATEAGGAERALRRLEWTVIRRLDGLLQGDYRTLMRGSGLDLADLREYQHHDDVRHIDWNVTARLQTPHVRVFTEDREMAAWFVLDLSRSVDFGSGLKAKREISAGFVGVLARLLTRHGNRVGALVYGNDLEAVIPPRSGRRHVLHLLHAMERRADKADGPAQKGMTRLDDLLKSAATLMPRRSTVFVVSDFLSEPGWERPLGQLVQRHEVIAVRLFDPLELELPDLGLVPLRDAETGEQLWVDTHDAGFRKRFARLAAEREATLRASLAKAGVDALELSTSDDLVEAIVRFADLRKRRTRVGSGASSGSVKAVAA